MNSPDVRQWLAQIGLGKYADLFLDNDIGVDVLPHLTEAHLRELGVSLGDRLRILDAPRSAPGLPSPASPDDAPAADDGVPSERSTQAEHRQLTVMFCDLVGSTALAGRVDLERYRDLIGAYQTATVEPFDGYVARYMGDGLLVYFGYPQAHEDDAERAVRAGLGVVEAVRRLAEREALALDVRIGIATGHVVAGDIIGEGASEEHAVLGDTPNLAARLQALAAPGAVLIAAATRELAAGLFDYEDLGPHEFKGFPGLVPAWRVIGEASAESRFAATRRTSVAALVGRQTEVMLLLDRWERAKDSEGQVVLLSGEPGIGKSRLTHALRERLEIDSRQTLHYQCWPRYSNSAFYPFVAHIRRAAELVPQGDAAENLRRLRIWVESEHGPSPETLPLLAALVSIPIDEPRLDMAPQRQKEKTVEALVDRLVRRTRSSQVLLIFEDVHWADPTTIDVLGVIINALATTQALLLITYRPEFTPQWIHRGHVTTHSLTRLGRRQVAEIVHDVTGGKSLPDAVLEEILAKTDGIPLFVEELTKTVLEAGFLEEGGSRFSLTCPLPALQVPSTLQDSLVARLDRLAEVKSVAQVASVIGREFSFELLSAVSPLGETGLTAALERLEEAELVYRRGVPPDATYLFKHALVQDAAYDSLLRRRREELHAQMARVLESDFPETTAREPELLAQHYQAAGLRAEAVEYWQRSAEQSLGRSAYTEQLAHLDAALEGVVAIEALSDRRQRELEIQTARGGALMASAGYLAPETAQAFEAARALASEFGDARQQLAALRGLHGTYFVCAHFDTALEVAETCLLVAEQNDDRQPRSLAHRLIGQTLCMQGQLTRAREHLERAMALDAQGHLEEVAALVHGGGHRLIAPMFMSHVLWMQGRPDRALELAEAQIEETESFGVFTVAAIMHLLCWIRGWRGEFDALDDLAGRKSRLAREHGLYAWQSAADVLPDWPKLATVERDEAASLARRRLPAVREERGVRSPFKLALLAESLGAAGDPLGLEVIDEALALSARTGEGWSEAELLRIKGTLLLAHRSGREAGERCLHQSLEVSRGQGAHAWELRAATSLARLWMDSAREAEAKEILAPVYEAFTEGHHTLDLREARQLLDRLSG